MAISDREKTEKSKQTPGGKKQPARDAKQQSKPKASPRHAPSHKGSKSQNALLRYFQETGDELGKVAWPNREQAVHLTLVVLGSTIATAIFFGLLDFGFQFLASFLV
ncbi:MAG: preprotein translocase subunit SecE [Anaerolineae bacterium]|nr:preprotein translocase subunit SecE [Anaerolineae bacterium]